jgi:cation:H+ antiporter
MNDSMTLILGVICAGIGGEIFVRGVVGLAIFARISPGIIGATIAAFGTSSPELSVAIISAMAGEPEISLGDALGSNVVNVALILAIALLISGIQTPRTSLKNDFPVALLIPIITGVLCIDGTLSKFDGFFMLSLFLVWLTVTVMEVKKQRNSAEAILGKHKKWLVFISCFVGLAFLTLAGHFIVSGARGIALSLGIDEFIIAATIVAIGTSVPELATTVIAKFRGHDELGLGTIIGSNIFNGIFIIAIAAIIHPITINAQEVIVTLVFGFLALICSHPNRKGFIGRGRGLLLLAFYIGYLFTIFEKSTLT